MSVSVSLSRSEENVDCSQPDRLETLATRPPNTAGLASINWNWFGAIKLPVSSPDVPFRSKSEYEKKCKCCTVSDRLWILNPICTIAEFPPGRDVSVYSRSNCRASGELG